MPKPRRPEPLTSATTATVQRLLAEVEAAMAAVTTTLTAHRLRHRQIRQELQRRAARAARCPARGPAPERYHCGDWQGHAGPHTALIPTGAPWFRPAQENTP